MKKMSVYIGTMLILSLFCLRLEAQVMYNDFDGNQNAVFGFHNGTLEQPSPNPNVSGLNTSPNVCKYTRNAAAQYDVLIMRAPGDMYDVTPYLNGQKKMKMLFYSPRPGVEISITLEDTNSSSPTNYPTGRHSVYKDTTTMANQWELLTFTFSNRPDRNAFNDGLNSVTISIASNTFNGSTYYLDDIMCPEYGPATPVIIGENMIEDFQSQRHLQYGFHNGTWVNKTANPTVDPVDTSAWVGQYTRNPVERYDVLTSVVDGTLKDIPLYLRGKRKFSMLIYTDAPIGTPVDITLENPFRATSTNYPRGRHSIYRAVNTTQNQWELVVFQLHERPDTRCSDDSLSSMTFSFNSNTLTGNTWYFDELKGPFIQQPFVQTTAEFGWDGFEGCGRTHYYHHDGTLSVVANPSPNNVNSSANCASYLRSNVQYDVIQITPANNPSDIVDYKNNVKKFSMKVYSPGPGHTVGLTAQDSLTATATNYPAGRYAEFNAITTKTNEWETLVFTRTGLPDQNIPALWINQVALLFDSGIPTTQQFYFDDLYGPVIPNAGGVTCPTGVLSPVEKTDARLSVFPNPANDEINVNFWQPSAGNVQFRISDALGREVASQNLNGIPGGLQCKKMALPENLAQGIYHLQVITNGSVGSLHINVAR